ncbi:shikimate kinase [Actinomadura formosensis]|uniref:shikimate kinase n=1 Tax=Actinomadura formosensis TaxID=60706 RepID=UPI00082CB122|nr:shikimate kinase [Actinomadura formosensis]
MYSALPEGAFPRVWRERLRHVYWIGGGSGAGKSTIARRIADRYGMRLYDSDAVMPDHTRRMPMEQAPYLGEFAAMDMDERWVTRSPREMLDTFHWFHGEGFNLILEDLLALPADRPVVVEGFRLLPDLVQPLLTEVRRAVWLLPTPQFRQAVFDSRGGPAWGFIAKTGDPQHALQNLLQRDALFTDRLTEQTRHLGLCRLRVDFQVTEEDLAQRVSAVFGLGN